MGALKIAHCRLYRYRLPMAAPLALSGRVIHEREGLLIRIDDDEGATGWGDVAPLPSFSRESIEDAETAAAAVARRLPGAGVDSRGDGLESLLELEPETAAPPSVRFGVEAALASLSRRNEKGTDADLACFDGILPVNGLLSGSPEQVLAQACRLRNAGCRAVKLKVGTRTIAQDVDLTRRVRDTVGNDMALRLDANRSWSLAQAVEFGREIGGSGVEFLKEPVADPACLVEFFDATGIQVALDESLLELRPDDLDGSRAVGAVVLKPTLLGGIGRASEWAARAQSANIRPVVSGCFESGVGLLALAEFAWSLTRDAVPAGLDTYRWLAADVVRPRIPVEPGAISWNATRARRHRIDMARLRERSNG